MSTEGFIMYERSTSGRMEFERGNLGLGGRGGRSDEPLGCGDGPLLCPLAWLCPLAIGGGPGRREGGGSCLSAATLGDEAARSILTSAAGGDEPSLSGREGGGGNPERGAVVGTDGRLNEGTSGNFTSPSSALASFSLSSVISYGPTSPFA